MKDQQPTPYELEFSRIFDAPRALVFRCMIEPEHLTHFWGPTGVSAPLEKIHVDAQPGGVFETVMVRDDDASEYATCATYIEVSEPDRLVWRETHSGITVTTTFSALDGDRTEVHIHQTNVPEAFRNTAAQAGFLSSLDRFDLYLDQLIGTCVQ